MEDFHEFYFLGGLWKVGGQEEENMCLGWRVLEGRKEGKDLNKGEKGKKQKKAEWFTA